MTPSSHPSTQPDSTHADSGMASSYDYVSDQSMMTGAHVGRHAREAAKVHRFGVNFSGSGSEYFRIWIVNLLLLIVTFGLYYPWAKVRKLRYFYNHTEVAGHPFDFHGNPRQMLRGFLLMAALLLAYGLAGNVSETAGAIAGLILALVWPALLRASLQFRLAQTSWRGLRFSFRGSMKDAYMVFLVPGLMMVGALVVFGILMVVLLPGRAAQGPMAPHQLGMAGLLSLLLLAAFMSLMPYLLWRLKAYQHRHYALGPWQTTFTATFGEMWRVFLRSSMVLLAGGVLVVALARRVAVALPGHREIGVEGRRAVQIGCNNARELLSLAALGAIPALGIDQSAAFLDQARELNKRSPHNAEFIESDIHHLPASDWYGIWVH